jgi:dienelactone hydrolase
MSWVSGTAPILQIEGAPAGLHFPGIENMPPQQLGDFFIDRHEVTQREFKRFVDAGGYSRPEFWRAPFVDGGRTLPFGEAMARFVDRTGLPGPATWEVSDYPEGRDDDPVTGVSWFEAAAYAAFAGKRLPTIYHWDHVAFTWGSGNIVPASNLGGDGARPVASGAARNRFGTEDLGGNAREWCANGDSRGGRFILGGGWDDPAYAFNDAFAQSPWDRSQTNGFRCIREVATSRVDPALEATIELPFRDFRSEPRVSDETFAQYLTQFRYDATPLRAEIEERLEKEDYIRERISFDAAYGGERMTAYLFLPKHGTPPYQTVVMFPGSGAIHTRSSADVAPGRGSFAPKGGRALLLPVYKSTYERGDGLVSDYPDTSNNWKDHILMWGKDFRRSIDYVETREDLDSGRIAYLGLSWGSAMAPFMIAIEPRVKAGVLVVAGLNFQKALPEVDEVAYTMRVKVPILMLNGKYDFFFPYDTSQLPFFELLGTPQEHKKLVVQESSHAFSQAELARESLAWLDQYLGPVR